MLTKSRFVSAPNSDSPENCFRDFGWRPQLVMLHVVNIDHLRSNVANSAGEENNFPLDIAL